MYRVVFEQHVKLGMEESFIKQWQEGSDIIQSYPGARGTKLFRSLDKPRVLYAIAEWENKEARDKAIEEIEKRDDAKTILKAHEQYVDEHSVVAEGEMIAGSLPIT